MTDGAGLRPHGASSTRMSVEQDRPANRPVERRLTELDSPVARWFRTAASPTVANTTRSHATNIEIEAFTGRSSS